MRVAVRVISLVGSERRQHMEQQLSLLENDWQFYDARTSAPSLPYSSERVRWTRGRELNSGELGCFASHHALWLWLASQSKYEAISVLEDDLLVDCKFLNRVHNESQSIGDIDYLRYYSKVPVSVDYVYPAFGRHIVRLRAQGFGTQGYFLTRAGAQKLLQGIRSVDRPVDDEMDRFWAHKLNVYAVFPYPIIELDLGSTIGASRRALADLSPPEFIKRLHFRASEKICRFGANLVEDIKTKPGALMAWWRLLVRS